MGTYFDLVWRASRSKIYNTIQSIECFHKVQSLARERKESNQKSTPIVAIEEDMYSYKK